MKTSVFHFSTFCFLLTIFCVSILLFTFYFLYFHSHTRQDLPADLFAVASAEEESLAKASLVTIHLDADYVVSKSELKVRVVASSKTPVNAFDIEFAYPREYLDFIRASTANSVVSVWQYLPADAQGGVIRLTGGMVKPFMGNDGEIITLVFFAKAPGVAEFVFKKTEFAVADGKGTVVSVPETFSQIVIAENGQIPLPEFQTPPPRVEAAVVPHPSENVAVLSIKTEDDGAVKEVLVRSREWVLWSEWQKARLTIAVPKYVWALQVAAIGWDGARGEATVYRWGVAGVKLFVILIALSGVWYFIILWRRKR